MNSTLSNCSVVGVQQLTTIFYTCILVDQVKIFSFQDGDTLLMRAAQKGDLSVVEVLVSVGAQVNSQNKVRNLVCAFYVALI